MQLATPTVLVNGESNNQPFSSPLPSKDRVLRPSPSFFDDPGGGGGGDDDFSSQHGEHQHGASLAEDVERTLTARLLSAGLGDGQSFDMGEARRVSEKTLQELRASSAGGSGGNEDAFLLNVSVWLGVAEWMGLGSSGHVKNFKVERSQGPVGNGSSRGLVSEEDDELEQHLNNDEDVEAMGPSGNTRDGETPDRHKAGRTNNYVYDISWQLQLGPLSGHFALHIVIPGTSGRHKHSAANTTELSGQGGGNFIGLLGRFDSNEDVGASTAGDLGGNFTEEDGEITWKKRFLEMQSRVKEKEEEFGRLKRKILDAVL